MVDDSRVLHGGLSDILVEKSGLDVLEPEIDILVPYKEVIWKRH